MASAGCTAAASSCCRVMLTLRIDTARSCTGSWLRTGVRMHSTATTSTNLGNLSQNKTWCRRWWNISRKSLSTSTRAYSPSLSPILCKEQQSVKEARATREKDGKESKETKTSKESKKLAKEKSTAPAVTSGKGVIAVKRKPKETRVTKEISQEEKDIQEWRNLIERKKLVFYEKQVTVEYHRGLPRITLPLPSRPEKCMFTLKPITQTIGDFLEILKVEDPAIIDASITTTTGIKMGAANRIEALLLDDFNLVINDKVYPVSPPFHIEKPKENLQQLKDVQALVHQLYETFNAREYHAELEREVMLHLEEVKLELEPLEQLRLELEESAARRSHLASWGVLVLMSMQFGCLARLTWWEYSWDIMEPVTYFVTYATAMGCYIYFLLTRQEYMLPDVFHREHLIGLHKRAKKLGFDLDRYNRLKEEAYELETMLRLIRGPLHQHQCIVEQKRQERINKTAQSSTSSSSSSSSSSSRSTSRSPSPTPDRQINKEEGKNKPSAVISN